MTSDGLLGTAVGLVGLAIALNVYKKVTGKNIDDGLKVDDNKSERNIW